MSTVDKNDPDFQPDKEDEEKLRPRATWSYRREMTGMDASDFESYIPGKKAKVEPGDSSTPIRKTVDLSKFAGAKFRYAEEVVNPKSRSMPKLVINEYVTKPKASKPTVVNQQAPGSATAPPPGVKVVRISKEEYAKLLAEKKITIVDGSTPSGQKIKLQAGLQLKKATPAAPSSTTQQQSVTQPAPITPALPANDESKDSKNVLSDSANAMSIPARDNLTRASMKKKRDPLSTASSSISVDIKTRLREIKDRMESKLQKSNDRVEMMYENSKVVNGETIFNVAPHKRDSEVSNPFGDARKRTVAQTSRYMAPAAQRFAAEVEKRQRGEPDGFLGTISDELPLKREVVHEDEGPPKKKVRFVDECLEENEGEGIQVAELNQRLWSEGKDGKSKDEESSSPHKKSSSPLSTSEMSVYEKWSSKAKRTMIEATSPTKNSSEPLAKSPKLDSKPVKKQYTMLRAYRPPKKSLKTLSSEVKDEGLEPDDQAANLVNESNDEPVEENSLQSSQLSSSSVVKKEVKREEDDQISDQGESEKDKLNPSPAPSSPSSLPLPQISQSQSSPATSSSSSSAMLLPSQEVLDELSCPPQSSSPPPPSSSSSSSSSSLLSSSLIAASSSSSSSSSTVSSTEPKSTTSSGIQNQPAVSSSSLKVSNFTPSIMTQQTKSEEEVSHADSPSPLSPPKLEPIEPLYPQHPLYKQHHHPLFDEGASTSSNSHNQEQEQDEEAPCLDNIVEEDNDNNVDEDSEMPVLIPDQISQSHLALSSDAS